MTATTPEPGPLAAHILTADRRPTVIADCVSLIESEVDSKGGLTGIAIKGAYKVVKTFKPGFVRAVVDGLIDEFVQKLEPHYAQHIQSPTSPSFGQSLQPRAPSIADELLRVTDQRAGRSDNGTIVKLYHKLRPSAQGHVAQAIPALGRLLDKHLTT